MGNMKIGALLKLRRAMWRTATVMALFSMVSLTAPATAAQQEKSREEAQKKTESTESKKASVSITVLLVDLKKKQSPQPLANATVKIKGEEHSYETDKDGKTPTFVILPGAKTIVIRPSGADPCNDVDVSVKEGNQVITVLVEMPSVKCSLQP